VSVLVRGDYHPGMARRRAELSETVTGLGANIDPMLGEVRVAAALADREGIVRWQNARWTEMVGDCIGHPLGEHVAPESTHEWRRQFTKKVIGTARTTDYEINMIAPDGRHVPIDVSSVVVEGADHRIVGVFGLVEPVARGYSPPPLVTGLTPRQLEILQLLDRGLSTTQIAERLGVQVDTVRNHIRALLRALGVHSRLQAVAEARRRGLIGS
jgi:DNA-binding CsgD family transcriptional regulator